jgi:hypothetical protein
MDPLTQLPPGSPISHAHLLPRGSTLVMEPLDSDDEELAASLGLLTQRQLDAARVQMYLLFYEDHALLWSSLEQAFHFWDERRLNRAIAYLEEVDAVDVEPAPAPNPWSPDDALVSVSSPPSAKLPLPWPGAHIHSPQYPATPAPPTFGFTSLIPSDGDDGPTHEYPFTLPSSAHAFSQPSITPGLRRGLSDLGSNRTMSDIFRFGSGLGMGLGMTGIKDLTAQPDLGDIPVTITPPSSDRWYSEAPSEAPSEWVSPNLVPVKVDEFFIGRRVSGGENLPREEQASSKEGYGTAVMFGKRSMNGIATPLDLSSLQEMSLTESAMMMGDGDCRGKSKTMRGDNSEE